MGLHSENVWADARLEAARTTAAVEMILENMTVCARSSRDDAAAKNRSRCAAHFLSYKMTADEACGNAGVSRSGDVEVAECLSVVMSVTVKKNVRK